MSYSSSTALSLLTALNNSSNSSTNNLLAALYGGGQTSSANPVDALRQAEKNQTKGVAAAANEPQTAREIKAFRAAVAKGPDAKTLLANPIARKVLLTANGLGSQADYAGLVSRALLSDTSKSNSLASKLSDTKWLDTAKTYDFANKGLSVLQDPTVLSTITNGYAEVAWRTSLDQTTPGLSYALDFRSRASTIKTVDQVLGDKTLREVITTALGIPKQIAFQSLQTQEKVITDHIDLTKFSKPAFVDQFVNRYLVQAGINANSGGNQTQSSGLLV
ncbi:MAG: hypothetical protein NVSMB18_02570 [Acetobacteraceae bacterium]